MVQLGTIQSNQGSRQNRSSELQIIQAFEKQAGGKGPFYLIEKGWWDSWTSFAARKDSAGAQDQNQGNSIVCRPGSIQNSQLVEAEQGAQHLKPGLKENQDFAIVCKESWDQLVLWWVRRAQAGKGTVSALPCTQLAACGQPAHECSLRDPQVWLHWSGAGTSCCL